MGEAKGCFPRTLYICHPNPFLGQSLLLWKWLICLCQDPHSWFWATTWEYHAFLRWFSTPVSERTDILLHRNHYLFWVGGQGGPGGHGHPHGTSGPGGAGLGPNMNINVSEKSRLNYMGRFGHVRLCQAIRFSKNLTGSENPEKGLSAWPPLILADKGKVLEPPRNCYYY
jgi:hypothetical protein